jgi:hypothetical protein
VLGRPGGEALDTEIQAMRTTPRCPRGMKNEKEYQGLVIRKRKGGESNRRNGLISNRSTKIDINQSRVSVYWPMTSRV